MTEIWIQGIDAVIDKFDDYRSAQLAIRRAAEALEQCEMRQTAQYKADLIRVAQEVPELQRLIEKEESIREEIAAQCRDAGDLIEEVYSMWSMLTNSYQRFIIQRYYLDCLPMVKVSDEIHLCLSRCWEIRIDAFQVIAEKSGR